MTQAKINLIAYLTLSRREVSRFLRVWPQSIMPSAITMALYFLVFGRFVGSRIGSMGGVDYMDFIAPGLVMMAVITNSYANSAFGFFMAKFQHSIEECLVAPMPSWVILLGYTTAGVLRGVIVGVMVMFIAMIFGGFSLQHFWLMLAVILLSSLLFSLAGLLNGVFAKSFDDVTIIPTFVLTPLTYLGGVFYSINLLDPFWKKISLFNPVLYMVNAFRYGIVGISDISIFRAMIILLSIVITLLFLDIYVLDKGIGFRE